MTRQDAEELQQLDLSHLSLQEMTPTQRAELRRRYAAFLRHFGAPAGPSRVAEKRARPRRWIPGERG